MKKPKPEVLFLGSAIILLVLFLGTIIYGLQFLIRELNLALNTERIKPPAPVTSFDLKGVQELQLTP